MDTLTTKQTEMFIRVGGSRPQFLLACPDGSYGAELFDQLDLIVEHVRASAYEQSRNQSAVRECSGHVAATRDVLERRLDAVYQAVRVLGFDAPGLADKFRTPHGETDQGLITLAGTYTNDAFNLKAQLIKLGLSPDFIGELDAASQAFDAALNERTQSVGRRIAATAQLNEHVKRGLQIVRALGVLVCNVYADDPAKLALWESASHVEKPPRRSRPKGNNGNTPSTPSGD
jgi:hypothetical protein